MIQKKTFKKEKKKQNKKKKTKKKQLSLFTSSPLNYSQLKAGHLTCYFLLSFRIRYR